MNRSGGGGKNGPRVLLRVGKGWMVSFLVLTAILLGLSVLVWTGVRRWQDRHTVTGLAVVVARGGLHLRKTPDEKSTSLIVIPHGGQVEILGEDYRQANVAGANGQWRRARYEMSEGWVYSVIEYLYETKAIDKQQVVKPERGTELRAGPALDSAVVASLPQRSPVHCVLEGVSEPRTGRDWVLCEADGRRGFVRSSDLSNVVYEPEALSNGPFEGMDVTGMPDSYRRRELDRISCSGVANPPDEENCWAVDIQFGGDHFFLFLKDGKVRQIVGRRSTTPEGSILRVNSPHSPVLYCSDPEIKSPVPFVLISNQFQEGSKDAAGDMRFTGVVQRFWVYDQGTNRMQAVEPSTKATCFLPNPRSFD